MTFPSLINHAKVGTKLLIHRFLDASHHQMAGKSEYFSLAQPRVEMQYLKTLPCVYVDYMPSTSCGHMPPEGVVLLEEVCHCGGEL